MKFVGIVFLLVVLVINLDAGKVTWDENGHPTVSGTAGEGCTQSGFGTKEKNATKADCS